MVIKEPPSKRKKDKNIGNGGGGLIKDPPQAQKQPGEDTGGDLNIQEPTRQDVIKSPVIAGVEQSIIDKREGEPQQSRISRDPGTGGPTVLADTEYGVIGQTRAPKSQQVTTEMMQDENLSQQAKENRDEIVSSLQEVGLSEFDQFDRITKGILQKNPNTREIPTKELSNYVLENVDPSAIKGRVEALKAKREGRQVISSLTEEEKRQSISKEEDPRAYTQMMQEKRAERFEEMMTSMRKELARGAGILAQTFFTTPLEGFTNPAERVDDPATFKKAKFERGLSNMFVDDVAGEQAPSEIADYIFGEKEKENITSYGGEVLEGVGLSATSPAAFPVGVAMLGLDFSPIPVGRLARSSRYISKVDDAARITDELKKFTKGSEEDIAKLAGALSKVDNERQIKNLLKNLQKTQKKSPGAGFARAAKEAETIRNARNKAEVARAIGWARGSNTFDNFKNVLPDVTKRAVDDAGISLQKLYDDVSQANEAAKTVDEAADTAAEIVKRRTARPSFTEKVARVTMDEGAFRKGLSDELAQWMDEAKRYESRQAFVRDFNNALETRRGTANTALSQMQKQGYRDAGEFFDDVKDVSRTVDQQQSFKNIANDYEVPTKTVEKARTSNNVDEFQESLTSQEASNLRRSGDDAVDSRMKKKTSRLRRAYDDVRIAGQEGDLKALEKAEKSLEKAQVAFRNRAENIGLPKEELERLEQYAKQTPEDIQEGAGDLTPRYVDKDQVQKQRARNLFNRVRRDQANLELSDVNRPSILDVEDMKNEIPFPSRTPELPQRAQQLDAADIKVAGKEVGDQADESFKRNYQQEGDLGELNEETFRPFNEGTEELTEESVGLRQRIRNAFDKTWTDLREAVDDSQIRVLKMIRDPNVTVREQTDMYMAEQLYRSRIGSKVEDTQKVVRDIDNDLVKTAKSKGYDVEVFDNDVQNYLLARHAPERNAVHGDGAAGISTSQARKLKKNLEDKYGDDLIRISDRIQEVHNQTLDELLEGGVISREFYDKLKETYKHHVPLQRAMDDEDNIGQIISAQSGFDVKGTGVKAAKGSSREVKDIFTNVVHNYRTAVVQAEKNRVDLTTLQFVRENKQYLDDKFSVYKPKAIGKTWGGDPIIERIDDPQTLMLRENGESIAIRIEEPKLAAALRGVNRGKSVSSFGIPGRLIGGLTRLTGNLATKYSIEFAFSNQIRDIQEASIYMSSQGDIGTRGALQQSARMAQSWKDVAQGMRGANTRGARLYRQMQEDGGVIRSHGVETYETAQLDLQKIRNLNRSNTRKALGQVVQKVEAYNRLFEDATRLSAYRTALAKGASRQRAAYLAKNASVNFDKKGTMGPMVNSLYLFSNASIQGSAKFLRSMKNPKTFMATSLITGGAVGGVEEWNDMMDPEWRNKISDWDRANSLNLFFPSEEGEANYFSIPVSWGAKPLMLMMKETSYLARGYEDSYIDASKRIINSFVESFNPLGGTDLWESAMPTIGDVPLAYLRNRKYTGGKIYPEWNQNQPARIRYFEELEDSTTGQYYIGVARGLSHAGIELEPGALKYGVEQYLASTGREVGKTYNTIADVSQGDVPEVRETPIASRFFTTRDVQQFGTNSDLAEDAERSLREDAVEDHYIHQRAEESYRQLKNIPDEEANKVFRQIRQNNPEVARELVKIKKEEQEAKLTYPQRQINAMSVEDGHRAKFIYKKIQEKENPDMKNAFFQELREKGVISDQVLEQLRRLKKGEDPVQS